MAQLIAIWRALGRSGRAFLSGAVFVLATLVGHKVRVRQAENRGRSEGENAERSRNEEAVRLHRKRTAEVVNEKRAEVDSLDRAALLERMRREARDYDGGDR